MVKIKVLTLLLLFSFMAMPTIAATAASECEAVEVPGLMKLHLQEVHAALSAGAPLQEALRTGSAAELEEVLAKSDDSYDITMIMASLSQAEKSAAKQAGEYALIPLYSLVRERIVNAIAGGRADLAKTLKKIESKLEKVSARAEMVPMALDLPQGWQAVLISLEDNGKGRRREHLQRMVNNHGFSVIASFDAGSQPGYTNEVTRYLIAGKTDRIMKLATYFKGEIPSGVRVSLHLKSGGAFSKIESDLTVKAPEGLDPDASIKWLQSNVVSKGWDYIYNDNFDLLKKHAKEKVDDGRVVYRVKSAQISYSVEAITSAGALRVADSSVDQGDLDYRAPSRATEEN
ncbi:MAG: hypothetical protein CVV64_10735 [Candidatus Wallbacteria bacterium HGW-Wallbacteria-1]|jgi:hypothetical protein|uniref:Uncharacterized protein n=1 Tax=Candidatus Wallbacteria bacterium HGW-Wallbacteria-1 TaxID=2013854 RepID=A0A2N1PPC5_9BACT|nr:MAG: hypothetical protein CVV64_10735 [Candidatus Wallbacteria bacterium HGW-Wallbacteria-1]